MNEIIRMRSVEPVLFGVVKIMWRDGFEAIVDLRPVIAAGEIFAFLRDPPERFEAVRLDEYGHSIRWIDNEGDEVDSVPTRFAVAPNARPKSSVLPAERGKRESIRTPSGEDRARCAKIRNGSKLDLRSHRHRLRPGGYVCAIRAAQLGIKAASSKRGRRSAAPASTSAASRRRRSFTPPRCSRRPAHGLGPLGVVVAPPKLDLPAMMKHKDETVAANVNGVAFLFKKNKIDWVKGEGRIAAPGKVVVKGEDGAETTLGDQSDRDRHRLRRRAPARRRDRREDGRLVDGRAEPARGSEEARSWSAPA